MFSGDICKDLIDKASMQDKAYKALDVTSDTEAAFEEFFPYWYYVYQRCCLLSSLNSTDLKELRKTFRKAYEGIAALNDIMSLQEACSSSPAAAAIHHAFAWRISHGGRTPLSERVIQSEQVRKDATKIFKRISPAIQWLAEEFRPIRRERNWQKQQNIFLIRYTAEKLAQHFDEPIRAGRTGKLFKLIMSTRPSVQTDEALEKELQRALGCIKKQGQLLEEKFF